MLLLLPRSSRALSTSPGARMATYLAHSPLCKPRSSLLDHLHQPFKPFSLSIPFPPAFSSFSSLSFNAHHKKSKQPIASLLEIGGVKIARHGETLDYERDLKKPSIKEAVGLGRKGCRNMIHKVDLKLMGVSRKYNDTHYVDAHTVLRCHTSAHQAELLRKGHTHFLVTGDVYHRDSIDSTHYPVFHQMEGIHVFSPDEWVASSMDATSYVAMDLKKSLEGLAQYLFGAVEMRWVDTYFPFTNPFFELEMYFQEKWMEVLGCGVTEQEILKRNGRMDSVAWAFGLGLERLAMVLFEIPDIRLFWSTDHRFTSQVLLYF